MSKLATAPANKDRLVTPLLHNGDRMNAAEFEARYTAMPYLKKAELLEGVVYMSSPVSLEYHGEPHSEIVGWLLYYKSLTRGVRSGDNTTVRLGLKDQPQPDALLMIPPLAGGQATILSDGFVSGAPELACEVAYTSASYDLGIKQRVFAEHGIREYLVWIIDQKRIEWFVLEDGQYVSRNPDANDIFRSTVFPGLWLDWKSLLTGDLARVFAVVQQGCATPEHKAFVEQLAAAKT
jgi:Uma2 family endonuclease